MLANGATLGLKKGSESSYTILKGLKEIPDIGGDPENVENSALDAKYKQYEKGVGDAGDLVYKFKYDNTTAGSTYRTLRALADSDAVASFEETLKDGTKFQFDAQVSVKLTGGALNGVIDLEATMSLQSDIEIIDPA